MGNAADQTTHRKLALARQRLPNVCDSGHALIVSRYYDDVAVAMAVIMRSLLSRFNPESFTLVTRHVPDAKLRYEGATDYRMREIPKFLPSRFSDLWVRLQTPFAVSRVKRMARRRGVKVILATHVDMQAITIARKTARALKLPWAVYIHNMIVENYRDTKHNHRARRLQAKVFSEASSVLVMCGGIADLYLERYGFASKTLVHNHAEPVPVELPTRSVLPQGLLAGAIYEINARSAKRVLDALTVLDLPMVITTRQPEKDLQRFGITGPNVKREFYAERADYLNALERQSVLVVALDWPDESPESGDELATLLPTRVIEYLASGRPVLVHCPESCFTARFLRQHACALVVSERSVSALASAIKRVMADGEDIRKMRRAGLETVRTVFAVEQVAAEFKAEMDALSKLTWGQKLR